MIKELAKTIVQDKKMSVVIKSAEHYADYLIVMHHITLRNNIKNLIARDKETSYYLSEQYINLTRDIRIIKDESSRNLLIEECSKLILMNSLEEIL